jgi:hypothetical protein
VFVNLACQKCKKKVFYLNIKHDVKPTSLTAMQERLNLFLIYFVSKQNFDENKNCRLLQKNFSLNCSPHYVRKTCLTLKAKCQKFETKLKAEGKWEEYKTQIHNEGTNKMIEDYKKFIEETINESNNSYVTEHGDVENWVGGFDKEKILNEMEEGIKYLESLKKS